MKDTPRQEEPAPAAPRPAPAGARREGPWHAPRLAIGRIATSFSTQVLVLFVVATLTPVVLALGYTQAQVSESEVRAARNILLLTRSATSDVEGLLADARRAAGAVTHFPGFWDVTDAQRDLMLAALAESDPRFVSLLFFTPDFQERGISTHQPGAPRLDMSERPVARAVAASGRFAVGTEAALGRSSGQAILPVAVAIREPAAPFRGGFVIVALRLETLAASWAQVGLPPGMAVLLVEQHEGRVLAGTGSEARPGDTLGPAHLAAVRAGQATHVAVAADGVPRLYSQVPVADTPWVMAAEIPMSVVAEPIYAAGRQQALPGVLVSGLLDSVPPFVGQLSRAWPAAPDVASFRQIAGAANAPKRAANTV